MSAAFLISFLALIIVSLICGKTLGLWVRVAYFVLWLGAFVVAGFFEWGPLVFGAFQILLAIAMLTHALAVFQRDTCPLWSWLISPKMKRSQLVLIAALAFVSGTCAGWFLQREPSLKIKMIEEERAYTIYTYYLDSAGREVKHGPLYVWRWNYPIRYELEQRYRKGVEVHSVETTTNTNADRVEQPTAELTR